MAGRHSWLSRVVSVCGEGLAALLRAAAKADEPTNELIPETTPWPGELRCPPVMPRMAVTPSMPASENA